MTANLVLADGYPEEEFRRPGKLDVGKKSRLARVQRSRPNVPVAGRAEATLRLASSLHARGELSQAEPLYRQVLRSEPKNFDALHMTGVLALQTGQLADGIELIETALHTRPDHPQALANLGNGYLLVNRPQDALHSYDRALALQPDFAGVLNNRGNALQSLGRHEEAADAFARLAQLAPDFDFVRGNGFHSRRHGCDWSEFTEQVGGVLAGLDRGRRVDRPFSFLSVSDAGAHQLQCARLYGAYLCPAAPPPLWRGELYHHDRIRVAYISADVRDHVVTRFMTPLYERHDRQQFELLGVSLTASDDSAIVVRCKAALDQFVDASRLNDQEVAAHLRALEVDIAVDLTGYTQGSRPGIFARRPVPAQVNFLGFPGTLGVPWIDYIIADEFLVPESSSHLYAESIVRLPDCFQVNDDYGQLPVNVEPRTRATEGLPATGPILCCFSNHYKLNPAMFDTWMRVMRATPDSVLWLLGSTPALRRRLQQEADARGVSAHRLLFAERVPYEQHLARLALADLFMDTLPFNAGATASDALRAGVPVLTCAGEAFAARMAGSLLHAIGLPELITTSTAGYEQLAIELLSDSDRLAALRARLASNRRSSALYDGLRYCRHLEDGYRLMVQRTRRGEAPASIRVPARAIGPP
jgi:predicted O-linked N-acetylglucosamine transferase (SPINDLY family)